MKIHVQQNDYALTIADQFMTVIQTEMAKADVDLTEGFILNFKDPDYSAERGGYHPVEIYINQQGRIQYVTDFAYVGSGYCAELVKELDFDFSLGLLQQFGREYAIEQAYELFGVWQQNFCAYYQQGIFTVTASPV